VPASGWISRKREIPPPPVTCCVPKEARTAYRREIDGLEHCYCRPCKAYLPSRCFHASALRVKRRRCKSCYEKHKRARSSPVARLLKNLRQRLRRTNPALARRWEEQDILAVLRRHGIVDKDTMGKHCIVAVDRAEPLVPTNSRPMLSSLARGRHHLVAAPLGCHQQQKC